MAHDSGYQDTAPAERIDRDVLLPASPDDLWAVITGDGWLAERVELELEPGGEARFTNRDAIRTGWVEEARPPGLDGHAALVFWWGPEGDPATRVELELEPGEDGCTRLRVAETRPLEQLDLVGVPLPDQPGRSHGPAMLAVA